MSAISYFKDMRILALVAIFVALLVLDLHYGLHFGIEFLGGTQIPVTLQHSVNSTQMSQLISDLDQRVSTFGLKQVTVEGVGNSEVYVTIPSVSPSEINHTISIIESQGRFEGIVAGRQAVNGTDILPGSIGQVPPILVNGTVEWEVTFFIKESAVNAFAKAVFGQANQPLYMFLDRPANTILVVNSSILGNESLGLSQSAALSAIEDALAYNASPIPVLTVSNTASSENATLAYLSANRQRYSTIFASSNLNSAFLARIKAYNYTVMLESAANMTPSYFNPTINQTVVSSWPLVGLLEAPSLSPSVTNGTAGDSYIISGYAPAGLSTTQKESYATNQTKTIASILSGGALPVSVIVGTPTNVSPTLGKNSLNVSAIALISAVVLISVYITVRYRRIFLVLPILATTLMELFIIVSIIGLVGTIDLSAFAGMIAVVGTGVDAQIIITDEMLNRGESGTSKTVLGKAFYIVWADATLLIIAMLPLFFSTSLVTVIGFSESTIIGALMGVLITRPAYGAILGRHFKEAE
ncbi:hypothetical protein M1329_00290 [Candidatus Marsarchaeota archaeon]|jgi:preprotein translocase subunit SecD|nr:hypothetical protein [Candidatus Marsarchaeota archaeon]MCL5099702.1 hypothetical protein [Candidatus Marsarchaeota archaeon]